MSKLTSFLAFSLLTVSALLAAPDQDKQSGRSQNGKPVKSEAKPSAQKFYTDGQPTEAKYQVFPAESIRDDNAVSSRRLSGDEVNKIVAFSVLLISSCSFFWWLGRKQGKRSASSSSTSTTIGSNHSQLASDVINSLSARLNSLATANDLSKAQTSINASISTLGSSLVPKVTEAAIAALAKSELGELRQKLANSQSELDKAKCEIMEKDGLIAVATSGFESAHKTLARLESEKKDIAEQLSLAQGSFAEITKRLEASEKSVQEAQALSRERQAEVERLISEVNKGYEVLAPANLKATELRDQLHAMYQGSLSGNSASVSAWTTLTVFVSAQADPSAKDFQLQIVRRLGVTLVSYWKQQGLTDKERHDRLIQWAKALNEHADGRYNLLVPTLGEPVDRSRMSCATSVTAIREVLCWQVRNPAGANFSLAEVA